MHDIRTTGYRYYEVAIYLLSQYLRKSLARSSGRL